MHNKMHIRDSHEMTEIGLQWQIRCKDEFYEWMSSRVKT